MPSFKKKVTSILKDGTEPLIEGIKNFNNPKIEIETIAESRALTCIDCINFKIEPISFFRVIDVRIPEISKMYCFDCGCTLSYKLRQSNKICPKW